MLRRQTVRQVPVAIRSSGQMTVMMSWLGIKTPPTAIRDRTNGAQTMFMLWVSTATMQDMAVDCIVRMLSTIKPNPSLYISFTDSLDYAEKAHDPS